MSKKYELKEHTTILFASQALVDDAISKEITDAY